jgi:2-haloacid dehalogenase
VDWQSGFRRILEPVAGEATAKLLDAYHRHERLVEAAQPFKPYKEVLALSLARAANEIGLAWDHEQADVLSKQWNVQPIFEDVEPALEQLRCAGWNLAVLTNCAEELFEQTHRCFRERFNLVVTAERVRSYKPGAAHFRVFREQTGVQTDDWVHACSLFHDIAPARDLGISHIWLDREHAPQQPVGTFRIHSAQELKGAIDKLKPLALS